jgi:hypothetical protein
MPAQDPAKAGGARQRDRARAAAEDLIQIRMVVIKVL